jgi:F-type H+-transporting ATPase subunit b
VSPTLATFLFELVNFILLAGLLGWLLFKPVRAALQARQTADKKHADDLAARAAETERLHAEWARRNASFETEITQTRARRLAAAEQEAAAIIARARDTADREREHAVKTLAHVEQAQLDRLADAIAAASRDAVARLLSALGSPGLESSFLRAACHRLEALEATPLGAVLVESARPLGDQERDTLTAAVGLRATSLTFRVVEDLGAGIRVITARGLIDASTAGVGAAAERRLKDALAAHGPTVST